MLHILPMASDVTHTSNGFRCSNILRYNMFCRDFTRRF